MEYLSTLNKKNHLEENYFSYIIMTFSIKLWVLHHVLIRHKNISDKYHKSLIKKVLWPRSEGTLK